MTLMSAKELGDLFGLKAVNMRNVLNRYKVKKVKLPGVVRFVYDVDEAKEAYSQYLKSPNTNATKGDRWDTPIPVDEKFLNDKRAVHEVYTNLANAIVEKAASDYRYYAEAKIEMKRSAKFNQKTYDNICRELKLIEKFFLSDRCFSLVGVDGEFILKKLRDEICKC